MTKTASALSIIRAINPGFKVTSHEEEVFLSNSIIEVGDKDTPRTLFAKIRAVLDGAKSELSLGGMINNLRTKLGLD